MSGLRNSLITDAPVVTSWRSLYKIGAIASVMMILLIPIQIFVFVAWPPPSTIIGWFHLFQNNWLLGLLSLDLLYILNSVLLVPMYIALYVALKNENESYMIIALVVGLIGIAAYFASNPAFEMLSLSEQYSTAATDSQRFILLASGQTMLTIYKGTAFNAYYILNDITLLIISTVMLRSKIFSKVTAYTGLLAGLLMTIPSTAGTIGLIFSLTSLIPWTVFTVLIARRFFQFGHPVCSTNNNSY